MKKLGRPKRKIDPITINLYVESEKLKIITDFCEDNKLCRADFMVNSSIKIILGNA